MKRLVLIAGAALAFGAPYASAQDDDFDVTFEVLDDVSHIDAVVLRLEEARDPSAEDADRDAGEGRDGESAVEELARDDLEEHESDREPAGERDERRENDVEDPDDEREVETEPRQ